MQLSSSISVRLKVFYPDKKILSLHQELKTKTDEIISLIRKNHPEEWKNIRDHIIYDIDSVLIPLWKKIEDLMINEVMVGRFYRKHLPIFYSLYQKIKRSK